MQDIPRPSFLVGTMSWIAHGYSYADPLPHGYGQRTASDPWEVFVYVMEEAKAGRFESLSRLRSLLLPPISENFAEAGFGLLGDAGSSQEMEFVGMALAEGPIELLPIAADAAAALGSLRLVPQMLEAWQRVDDRFKHLRIGSALSRLLEDPGGPISQLSEKFSPDIAARSRLIERGGRYAALADGRGDDNRELESAVRERYTEVLMRFGADAYLWRGQPFNLKTLLEQMHIFAHDASAIVLNGLFISVRRKIEATTGRSLSGCFRKGSFNPLGTAAVLDDLLEHVDVALYQEGRKYFFGHLIA